MTLKECFCTATSWCDSGTLTLSLPLINLLSIREEYSLDPQAFSSGQEMSRFGITTGS